MTSPAAEIRVFQVTTPAGTAKASPLITSLAMPPRNVNEIDIIIPPGPNGQLGIALATGGINIIPAVNGTYVTPSGEQIKWTPTGVIQSGAWQLISYNTGNYAHTIEIRFLLSVIGGAPSATVTQPLPVAALSPLPDAVPAGSPNDAVDISLLDVTP